MTSQEIFDACWAHAQTMQVPSMYFGRCAYRGEGGSKCLIGALIPDKLYSPVFEGKSVLALLNHFTFLRPSDLEKGDGELFLKSCQDSHDHAMIVPTDDFRVRMFAELRRVARGYKLTVSAVEATA